jgi:glycerol uptake facilitator-like aquaporin
MGERLSGGNAALALFGNSTATGAILIVLIGAMGPVSGAHFNPLVTLAFLLRREIERHTALAYIVVQIAGAVLGTWATHLMFGVAPFEVATKARSESALWLAEAVATFGLILTMFGALRWRAEMVPTIVGLYIAAAYWFTASTSFANPAVTIARALTDTFTGIAPSSVPAFIAAQTSGALVGLVLSPARHAGRTNMTPAAAGRVDKGLAASYVSKCFCFPGIFSTLSAGLMGNLAGERPAIRGL